MNRFPLAFLAVVMLWACGGGSDDDGSSANDGGIHDAADPADAGPPPKLALETVATGLDEPLLVTSPPGDDRLFVVEKAGVIRVVEDGSVLATPFLDITGEVFFSPAPNEQGLLGLTFHPSYAQNGRFFVFYIADESVEGPRLTSSPSIRFRRATPTLPIRPSSDCWSSKTPAAITTAA